MLDPLLRTLSRLAHLFLRLVDLLLKYALIVSFVGWFVVPPGLILHCGLLLVELSDALGIPSQS